MDDFVKQLDQMINERKKMTSPLYQTILNGKATLRLLQNFAIHRYPIKNLWTRHVMGVAARVEEYTLRRELVINVHEEETGSVTNSDRHVQTFVDFAEALGVSFEEIEATPLLPETKALMEHNLRACNDTNYHFTVGVAAVLLLMEGQPPIVDARGKSMLSVMRDVYCLPPKGYEFFIHHASSDQDAQHVSELEDDHAEICRELLRRYCTTDELKAQAIEFTRKSIELRHAHFDAMYKFYNEAEPIYRNQLAA